MHGGFNLGAHQERSIGHPGPQWVKTQPDQTQTVQFSQLLQLDWLRRVGALGAIEIGVEMECHGFCAHTPGTGLAGLDGDAV